MAMPDAQVPALNFIDLPTVIHIAIAGHLSALSLVHLGEASRWCHAFFPPLATGWLEVTDGAPRNDPEWPIRVDDDCYVLSRKAGLYFARHSASLARLLRQMPRLYFITLRGLHWSVLREIAQQTVPLLQNFEVSCHTVCNYRSRGDRVDTMYKSGRTSLPRPPSPANDWSMGYEAFVGRRLHFES